MSTVNMPDLWQVMLPVNLNVMKKLCKVVKRQKKIYSATVYWSHIKICPSICLPIF